MGGMRMTGLISGMDTESMVKELVKASSTKVDKVKQNKQKAEWKKEAWQSLNTKIYDLYKTQLAAFKTNGSYKSKKASVNDTTKLSVTANNAATNGTHTVSVKQIASSAYLTGGSLKGEVDANGEAIKSGTKLADMGINVGTTFSLKGQDFVVNDETTISDFTTALSKMGVTANFDDKQGRFYINANGTGADNDFTLSSNDEAALDKLGLGIAATKIDAKDAIIEYNGVEYRNATNSFDINGLSITAKAVTGEYDPVTGSFKNDIPLNIEVGADTEAAYNTVKDFVKAYNALIDEMNTLYNEKKSTYDPLTDEERSQLSDTQIEQWEKKAKEGLLNRDSTIQELLSKMRNALNQGVEVTNDDGTTTRMTLASLGVVTGDYSEHGKLHIMGDPDDAAYSSQPNKLKEMLEKSPNVVSQVLAGTSGKPGVGLQMYNSLTQSMKRIEGVRSSLTFYNDVTMKDEIEDYDDDIDKWQEKLQKMEDKYYDQFAAMESAMAKLQQQQSYLASLMGMGA